MGQVTRIELEVDDLDAAAGFYRRLLGDEGRRASESRHEFDAGIAVVLAPPPTAAGPSAPPCRLEIKVPDLPAAWARARLAGCSMIGPPPAEGDDGAFWVRDPWGVLLRLGPAAAGAPGG